MKLVRLPSCSVFSNRPTDRRTPLGSVESLVFSPNSAYFIFRVYTMYVCTGSDGGSFSVGRLGQHTLRGNALFIDLVEAVFDLELILCSIRPAYSMIIDINWRAFFLPHKNSGTQHSLLSYLLHPLGGGCIVLQEPGSDIPRA